MVDRYLVGAAVQYSYSSFVLLPGEDLQQEKRKSGQWGHLRRGEEYLVKCPPEEKATFSLTHSLLTHQLTFSYSYLSGLYCALPILDARG